MFLKPKHTYLDQPATHYKKVIDLTKYLMTETYYYYTDSTGTYVYYYDRENKRFIKTDDIKGKGILIEKNTRKYVIDTEIWYYNVISVTIHGVTTLQHSWQHTSLFSPTSEEAIISATDYRGQKNRYFRNGTFTYTIVSDINESITQAHKGLISKNKSFDIKYTDDEINIEEDDIILIDNELYFVSEASYKIIRLPKPYKTYFCTLTKLNI